MKFAISEYFSDIIESIAKHYGLNIEEIKTRKSLRKVEKTEILLTNYKINKLFTI